MNESSNYSPEILDKIIKGKYYLFNGPESSQSDLLKPLFSRDLSLSKKRNLQQFLNDYYQKPNDHSDTHPIEDSDEEEAPENAEALSKLRFPIDQLFQKELKSHQVEGLDFMWDRVYTKKQGCLLAHSMGLGKTLQVISLLTTMYQHLKAAPTTEFPSGRRVLILAPLVTLANWVYEFEKWAVNDVENVIGEVYNISEIKSSRIERMRYLKYWYTQGGVMLINYDLFRALLGTSNLNDQKEYCRYLVNPGPDIVILDEAHRIKNSSSLLSTHVNKIRTRSRICMTGYPLQNRLLEYYYMINFIAPGLLGSKDRFKTYFSIYIDKCYSDSSKHIKEQAAFKLYVLQLLTGHVTHRRDGGILEKYLPSKTEYVIRFKLSPVQHKGYTALLTSGFSGSPLVSLLILRSMCNHPKIFNTFLTRRLEKKRNEELDKLNPDEDDENFVEVECTEPVEEDIEVVEGESFKVIKEVLDSDLTEDNEEAVFSKFLALGFDWADEYLDSDEIESWKCSGKISFIVDLVKECKVMDEKIVIVSHSLACLDYIQGLLPIFGIKTLRLDGSVVARERQIIIDEFNNDRSIGVIFLSAKAAAIGINVTAANRIVLVDQDWNPLYDEQSIGRVYRYGQTKPVIAYRLITATTIEERIYMQSIHKRSISKRVIDNKTASIISKEDLVAYFQKPDAELKLIDMDDFAIKDMDWISSDVLKNNTDSITEFKRYEADIDSTDDKGISSIMTRNLRDLAKKDALGLIREWRDHARFNQ